MTALLTLIFAELRRRKLQNGLTALLLLLSTLLTATSVILIGNTDNRFEAMHEQANGSHELVILDQGIHRPEQLHDWWSGQPDVAATPLLPYKTINKVVFAGNTVSNLYVYMMNTPAEELRVDKLLFAGETETGQAPQPQQPEPGTIWLPTSMAYAHGIEVGDTVGFEGGDRVFQLQVSAIVVDIAFGAPFATTSRVWMNPADYAEQLAALPGEEQYMIGLRFQNYSDSAAYWAMLETELGTPYLESKTGFEEIVSFYLIMNRLIGFIMIVLGAVMLLIALITIAFTIADAVLSQYRKIGILKSIGMTSTGTTSVFVLQYAWLALLGVVPGLLLSGAVSGFIMEMTLSNLRMADGVGQQSGLPAMLAVGTVIIALTAGCALLAARRTRSIMPAQAIRYGMSESDSTRKGVALRRSGGTRFGFDRWPVGLAIGLRNIASNAKGSWLMLLIAVMSSAAIALGYTLVTSVASIYQTAGQWGYDNSDISAVVVNDAAFSRESFTAELLADSRVQSFGWHSDMSAVIPADPPLIVYAGVLEGSYAELGYEVLEGRHPEERNEIAIGIAVASQLGLSVGDTMDIYVQGQRLKLLVTGVYQAIANMSGSVRMTAEAVREHVPALRDSASAAFIRLHDSRDADALAAELGERYGASLTVATQRSLLDSVFREAVNTLLLPMILVALLFLGVAAIIVYSICRIAIRKQSRTYGIYKTLGMASRTIRLGFSGGAGAVAAIGAAIGTMAGVWLLPELLELVLTGYGIAELPLVLHVPGILAAGAASILPAIAGSWFSSRLIARTSPRELVVE